MGRYSATDKLGIIGMALLVLGTATFVATRFVSDGPIEGFAWLGAFLTIGGALLFWDVRRS